MYTNGNGVKEEPFFILTGAVAPNRPQLATGAKRKTGTIRDKLDRAIAAGRLDRRHKCWINESGVMDTEAAMYLIECHGTTKPKNGDGSYVLSSLLIDSHKPHKTDLVKEKCDRYNIRLFIVDGGLTPKANMADVDYIKSTKKNLCGGACKSTRSKRHA